MFENTFFELSIGLADVNFTAAFSSNLVNDPFLLASFAKHTFPGGLVEGAAVAGFEIRFIYYPAHQLGLSVHDVMFGSNQSVRREWNFPPIAELCAN